MAKHEGRQCENRINHIHFFKKVFADRLAKQHFNDEIPANSGDQGHVRTNSPGLITENFAIAAQQQLRGFHNQQYCSARVF